VRIVDISEMEGMVSIGLVYRFCGYQNKKLRTKPNHIDLD